MVCPICGGEKCISKSTVDLYLNTVESFFKSTRDNSWERYPTAGDVGECVKTAKRIWLCPYCKKPFEANFRFKTLKVQCPNCNSTLNIPASHRTLC
ncbi:MAG TPA: hypothetical protein EYH15_03955 [Methanothermococcus okinawensis]|uniref:Uncharacterized protein n=1 Tax=Methanothermococcus okinawensis TaxID=155863 RepID=A0A832ZJ07_9EURY|nr:hypothetical protein [Methanothermococcus okinawensis]HIP91367.1 hypothetical protein [Methanothermococcus okinawensis]